MRLLQFLIFITCIISCKQSDTKNSIYQDAITEVVSEIFQSSCERDSQIDSDWELFILLSDSIIEFNYNFKNFQFQNFNLDSFINKSKNLDYEVSNIPKED